MCGIFCLCSQNTSGNHRNEPVISTEESEYVSLQGQKEYYHRDVDKDKCTMPCEMTAKLMRDEKHSLCSRFLFFFCVQCDIFPTLYTFNPTL